MCFTGEVDGFVRWQWPARFSDQAGYLKNSAHGFKQTEGGLLGPELGCLRFVEAFLNRGDQLLDAERFGEESICSAINSWWGVPAVHVTGHHDKRGTCDLRIMPQGVKGQVTSNTPHVHVAQDEIGKMGPRQLNTNRAAARLKHLEPVLFQDRRQGAQERFLVVNH